MLDSDSTVAPLAAVAGLDLHADRDVCLGEGAQILRIQHIAYAGDYIIVALVEVKHILLALFV